MEFNIGARGAIGSAVRLQAIGFMLARWREWKALASNMARNGYWAAEEKTSQFPKAKYTRKPFPIYIIYYYLATKCFQSQNAKQGEACFWRSRHFLYTDELDFQLPPTSSALSNSVLSLQKHTRNNPTLNTPIQILYSNNFF